VAVYFLKLCLDSYAILLGEPWVGSFLSGGSGFRKAFVDGMVCQSPDVRDFCLLDLGVSTRLWVGIRHNLA
jgi:hypothetical protein